MHESTALAISYNKMSGNHWLILGSVEKVKKEMQLPLDQIMSDYSLF